MLTTNADIKKSSWCDDITLYYIVGTLLSGHLYSNVPYVKDTIRNTVFSQYYFFDSRITKFVYIDFESMWRTLWIINITRFAI